MKVSNEEEWVGESVPISGAMGGAVLSDRWKRRISTRDTQTPLRLESQFPEICLRKGKRICIMEIIACLGDSQKQRASTWPRPPSQGHALLPRATPSAWNPPSQDSAPPRVWASHQPSLLERCFLPPPQWEVPKRLWLHPFSSQIQLRTKVPWPKGSPRTFFCFLCTNDWI